MTLEKLALIEDFRKAKDRIQTNICFIDILHNEYAKKGSGFFGFFWMMFFGQKNLKRRIILLEKNDQLFKKMEEIHQKVKEIENDEDKEAQS